MADNYLEKKMEEYKARPWSTSGSKNHKTATTLSRLLVKNRKYDKFDNTVIVREEHLKSIAGVIDKIELFGNLSAEDFLVETLILEKSLSNKIENNMNHPIILGVNLQQSEQLNARAFITVKYNTNKAKLLDPNNCATTDCTTTDYATTDCTTTDYATIYFNLGIIAQSMLLRATEMGLNGNCIYFNETTWQTEKICKILEGRQLPKKEEREQSTLNLLETKLQETKLQETKLQETNSNNPNQSETNQSETNQSETNQSETNQSETNPKKDKSLDGTPLLIIAIGKGTV